MAGGLLNDWIWFDRALLASLWMTLGLVAQALGGSFLLGVPAGFAVARGLPHRARVWEPLLAWPFAIPASVAALQALPVLQALGWSYSAPAVVIVMVLLNAPFVALRTAQALRQVDARLLEQAAVLGASPRARWWWLWLPTLRPVWAAAAAEVYLACLHSLSLVLLLGGGPPVETVEVTLFYRLQGGGLDWSGSLLAGISLACLSLPAAGVLASGTRQGAENLFRPANSEPPRSRAWWGFGILALAVLGGVWWLPFVGLLRVRLTSEAAVDFFTSFAVSAWVAFAVAAAVVVCAVEGVRRVLRPESLGWLAAAATLASALSPMLIALGLIYVQLAVGQDPFAYPRAVLAMGLWIHFLPFAVRNLIWLQVSRPVEMLEAARLSGASPARAWWVVEWPRWRPNLLTVFGLLFVWTLGESSLTWLFTSGSDVPWVTALLARWAGQYQIEAAQSGALILLAFCAVGFSLLQRGKGNG